MSKFRIDNIEALARQMNFTPAETRLTQLASAEPLLHDLDSAKAYPLDFIVFRITGYHPKGGEAGELLTGLALQHDLGLLIETLSDTMDVKTAALDEPVLSIDDVTEKFNVTSKTIQRWRRRGLPARRFLFPDGKRRVGFLLSSVDRFFAAHRDQVQRGTNFSQVESAERDQIIRRARRLAMQCRCCEGEITRRIARKLNRSPLTILHTIRKHDEENAQAIFPHAASPITEAERGKILRDASHGVSIGTIAQCSGRTRQAVYRVIIEHRIAALNLRKVRFIDDSLYHQPDAATTIDSIVSAQELAASPKGEELRVPRDLPAYLAELYRTPLLTAARERAMFLKFNFHKFQFVEDRSALEPQFARSRELDQMESHLASATETKNAIVRANLRLVVSVARKHLRPGLNLMELISDGNITLMRAVEGFDIHKGYRFSTYATLALMKGFARSVPLMRSGGSRRMTVQRDQELADMPDLHTGNATDRMVTRDQVAQLLSRLNNRERDVLQAHYGIAAEGSNEPEPATYEEVGERLGLSKQRVRQIEQVAIAKLRASNADTILIPHP